MQNAFDEVYPNLSWWTDGWGWIELGQDNDSSSLVRVLDTGGMQWDGEKEYDTVGETMDAAEAFVAQWRVENGYGDEA